MGSEQREPRAAVESFAQPDPHVRTLLTQAGAPAYDAVAQLYDRAFADIRVRRAEWRWLMRRMAASNAVPRVLEIGCGTGALLRELSARIETGIGVDVSTGMIERAKYHAAETANLSFHVVPDQTLPFATGSFDLTISFLSFRYLDWPRILPEIRRVLAPGGRFLMIDLVSERARASDGLRLTRAAVRQVLAPFLMPRFTRDLQALTSHPDWKDMLTRHPIRSLAEYRAFFATELPGRDLDVLDVAFSRRVIALDSGPLDR